MLTPRFEYMLQQMLKKVNQFSGTTEAPKLKITTACSTVVQALHHDYCVQNMYLVQMSALKAPERARGEFFEGEPERFSSHQLHHSIMVS